tara:strand:- start:1126 stop:1368 length:243 start_codon:yes stop_codon:yes gene_type:complete
MSLISHLPLPSMPFQTHVNIVFENGVGEPVEKVTDKKEPTRVTPDTPVEDLKLVNQMYAYNPNPNKLRTPTGQIVDFIVA